MDTFNSVANNLSNSIWGKADDSKPEQQEPQSGVQGDTSKGEPFDGGNMRGRWRLRQKLRQFGADDNAHRRVINERAGSCRYY